MQEFFADKIEGEMQMKINEIFVDGFKNIQQCKVILDGISAILAPNNFGKSNLLEAIDIGIDFISQSTEEKLRTMSRQNFVPKNSYYKVDHFSFAMVGECVFLDSNYVIKYEFSWQWKTANNLPQILTENLKIKEKRKNSRYYNIITRRKLNATIRSTAKARCDKKIKINNSELVINKLKEWDDFSFLQIVKQVNSVEAFYEHQLDAQRAYTTPLVMMKNQQDFIELSTADEDMGKTLNYIKEQYPLEFEKIQDALCLLFPELSEIKIVKRKLEEFDEIRKTFPENNSFVLAETEYRVFFQSPNFEFPISIDYLSDGTKRILLLLTMVALANIRGLSLVEIEEAENHIHPRLLSSLLDILETLRGECNILISSHSPYMTQYISANRIYVGLYSKELIANFKRISVAGSRRIYAYAEQEGISASDYIFNLLCGDAEDQKSLLTLTEG